MKRPHPNRPYAAVATALLSAVALSGCRGQQTALSNPFLAPDRVPPPSTRLVPPGTAQPYYPGDPLPSAQASAEPATPTDSFVAANSNAVDNTPASTFVAGGESPVAIPGDNDDLRFALPEPPAVAEATPQPPAPSLAVVAAANPSYTSAPAVVPAAYDEADAYQVTPSGPFVAENGPWRAPQIPSSTATPSFAQNSPPLMGPQPVAAHPMAVQPMVPQPMTSQPTVPAAVQPSLASLPPPPVMPFASAPAPTMPVQLRAVPSPPLEVATSAAPRIRFADPNAPASTVNQAAYIASAPAGVVQTVPVTELPPNGTYWLGSPASAAAQPQAGPSASSDGFRPRGSTW